MMEILIKYQLSNYCLVVIIYITQESTYDIGGSEVGQVKLKFKKILKFWRKFKLKFKEIFKSSEQNQLIIREIFRGDLLLPTTANQAQSY